MRAAIAVIGVCLSIVVEIQPPEPSRPAPVVLIQDVTLIDGTGAGARSHADVLIRDGRIAEVSDTGVRSSDDAAIVLNGRGRYAIPGLFDAHVHLSGAPWEERINQLRRALAGGITSVYDVAGDVRETSDLARAELAGEIDSPAIDYAALMAGPAFFTDPRVVASSLGFAVGQAPWALSVGPDTDLARAVAAVRGSGASAIKLYAALDAATVKRIADEAHRQHVRLVAHATVFPARPSDLVAAGVNMLAHAPYLVWEGSPPTTDFPSRAKGDFAHVPPDSPAIEQLLASMRDGHVALNPTLWIFADGPGAQDELKTERTRWMDAVTRRASAIGVPIVAGTDGMLAPRDPLPILHRELELLVTGAGLSPMQALVSATANAAQAIGVDRDRGTIAAGKIADVVLLSGNPVEDIRNTRKIEVVVHRGRLAR